MPRKKKSPEAKADPKAVEAQEPIAAVVSAGAPELPSATGPDTQIDQEAEHRMQAESPALVQDAEAEVEAEVRAQVADTFEAAFEPEDANPDESQIEAELHETAGNGETGQAESAPAEQPPAKLERLQKILSQAGVASRRHAEELIIQGRVQVNGKIVTELGTKADPTRDHIRVDGKLLQGAERLRYFLLNKPKGYVTTVSDPEGRPTVMDFFSRMSERLYPVGRLDYLSEGLLLVTNDGDLANKLTRAAAGVEKTYLVKVSGKPTAEELDQLREGVSIDRSQPGKGRVRTAPAEIRQVRQGDNPWYEVVIIEGRNRELRKMFEEIGHFVEKIRRVGYGPLVLDVEPGKFRELEPDELAALRRAAEGKPLKRKAASQRRGPSEERGTRYKAGPARKHVESARSKRPGQFPAGRSSRPEWERPKASPAGKGGRERFSGSGKQDNRSRVEFGRQGPAGRASDQRSSAPARPYRREGNAGDRPARSARPFEAAQDARGEKRPLRGGSTRPGSKGGGFAGRGLAGRGFAQQGRDQGKRVGPPGGPAGREGSGDRQRRTRSGAGGWPQGRSQPERTQRFDRESVRVPGTRSARSGQARPAEPRPGRPGFEGAGPGSRGAQGRSAGRSFFRTGRPASGSSRPPSKNRGKSPVNRPGPIRGGNRPGGGRKRY